MSTVEIDHVIGGMDLSNLNEGQIVAIKRLAFHAEQGYDTMADDHRREAALAAVDDDLVARDEWRAASAQCRARANQCHTLYKRLSQLQQQGVES